MADQDGPFRVAVLDDYQDVARSSVDWSPLGPQTHLVTFQAHEPDQARLVDMLQPFHCVVAMRERTPFPAGILSALPRLRLLVTTGMVNNAIDLAAAAARGVVVCGTTKNIAGSPVAELTWGLILAAVRGMPTEIRSMDAGGWQVGLGSMLHGKTLGVLGLGRLGAAIIPVAHALQMRVVAWSQNLTAERAAQVGAELVERCRLFRESDVLSIHLKLSERTRGLVGPAELALMKPTALLVNTSRGPIVDEAALIAALQNGAIGGAALDVFDQEPLPADHPLRSMPNALLTPHIGYVTRETYAEYFAQIVEDIVAYRAGQPVRTLAPRSSSH